MSRPPRLLAAGCTYHVTARGNDRQLIFLDDHDRSVFVRMMDSTVLARQWKLLAFCLMDNHVHLAVETPRPDLADGMRDMLSAYARRHNRRRRRTGHLFGGRYGAVIVRDDRQLFAAIRYIARNPAEAGMVRSPADWPWGSYAGLVGDAPVPKALAIADVLALFHPVDRRARDVLKSFVEPDARPSRLVTHAERPRPSVLTLVQLCGVVRGAVCAVELGYTHREVAQILGIPRSTLTRWVGRQRSKLAGPFEAS